MISLPPKNNLTIYMNTGLQILSDLTIFSKYAKYLPEQNRREDWNEIVSRYELMMITKYPKLEEAR
jgi:ribonucleoside-diphosphate reductase alpha chain